MNKKIRYIFTIVPVCVCLFIFLGGCKNDSTDKTKNDTGTNNLQTNLKLGEEYIEPGEEVYIENIARESANKIKALYTNNLPAKRDAHPKIHGLVRAEVIVLADIPDSLKIGLFKTAKKYDAWIRYSAGGTLALSDTTKQGRGMAIKLVGVDGEKILEDDKNAKTMDFVMINYPGFIAATLPVYDSMNTAILGGTAQEFFKTHQKEGEATFLLSNQPLFNPLQVQYFSQVPYKLGPHAVKYSAKPISNNTNAPVPITSDNFFTMVMAEQLGKEDVYFELMIQVQTDPVKMPVENSLIIWDQKESPFIPVALIRIPKQVFTSPEQMEYGDNLSFNPWHTLPEHRPLGNINRTRRVVYETISKLRHQMNNKKRKEPTEMVNF
ncbi:MAG: catalase family protein [Ignavibacteria bacterium]|nr:catalase family protein [Ignavibacteria bacterium]